MQKALILALLIGAFLLPRYVTAQDPEPIPLPVCDEGETVLPGLGCGIVAPEQSCKLLHLRNRTSTWGYGNTQYFNSLRALTLHISAYDTQTGDPNCGGNTSRTATVRVTNTHDLSNVNCPSDGSLIHDYYYNIERRSDRRRAVYTPGSPQGTCEVIDVDPSILNTSARVTATFELSDEVECSESYPIGPVTGPAPHELNQWCYRIPVDEPPEECDDIVGNCEPDPECFPGGNGMEVCPKDPNETCESYTHNGNIYYDCPVGCGFIQGTLYCTTEPDSDGEIPDLSNCFKIATGWACPPDSPTPDDNIDNPEKPLPDMNKGDFKQVNIGIETRLDATNKLLGDIAAIGESSAEGLADLNSKALAGNKKLDDIIKNTGATVDALTGDGESADMVDGASFKAEIANALGITGDESIEDLTIAEVALEDFKSDFSWSVGSSQCPQPRAINMIGRTFYMDWDPFCQAFTVLGYFILAAAYFFSTIIAFKGK